jgi:hypothetical protein
MSQLRFKPGTPQMLRVAWSEGLRAEYFGMQCSIVNTRFIAICNGVRVHTDVTICWQAWTGTSGDCFPNQQRMLEWESNGSDSSAVRVQLSVKMVEVTDVSEELLSLLIIIKDETSVVITILRWCCPWTQNILPHCTASSRSPSDQERPTSFSTPLLHRKCWESVWCYIPYQRVILN